MALFSMAVVSTNALLDITPIQPPICATHVYLRASSVSLQLQTAQAATPPFFFSQTVVSLHAL